jgi:DNA (cytosine-5)-methyltransferase 1
LRRFSSAVMAARPGPHPGKRAWAELGVDGIGVADCAPGPDAPATLRPRLTCEMVARLQGWQDDLGWRFSGRKTARYRQIGNAFPPPVAEALGSGYPERAGARGRARDGRGGGCGLPGWCARARLGVPGAAVPG